MVPPSSEHRQALTVAHHTAFDPHGPAGRGQKDTGRSNSQEHLLNGLCTRRVQGSRHPKCTSLAAIAAPAGTPTLAADSPVLPFVQPCLPK